MKRLYRYSQSRSTPSFLRPGVVAGVLTGALGLGCGEPPPPPPPATAAPLPSEARSYVEGEVLVRFRSDVQAQALDASHGLAGARVVHRFRSASGLQQVRLPEGMSVEQALEHYRQDPRVAYAEPNAIYTPYSSAEDWHFPSLWALDNTGQTLGGVDADLNAPEAWALTRGSEADVVAVIDSGVDFTHPDLAANMWVNPGELAGNGVDDDGNGYVDDIHGIDATDVLRRKPPMDVNGHGTHVAGIIAARAGNGPGVVGVSPRTKLLACKIEDEQGRFVLDAAVRCLDYLLELKRRTRHPVNIIATNNSWGGGSASQALRDAIIAHQQADILFVAASGNSGLDLDADGANAFPAEFDLPNILSVGASDASDRRAAFSNFGRQRVDIFAPGVSILSTAPGGGHAIKDGTSMAAPHVTGLVALLHAQAPERDWRALRSLVLSGGQEVPGLRHLSVTGRRIRAFDTGGVGSLSCADQVVVRRMEPSGDVVHSGVEAPGTSSLMTLTALSIRCGQSAGPVTVTLSTAPGSLVLLDDGQAPDLVAGDGLATAQWLHPGGGPVTFTFPDGDTFLAHPSFSGAAFLLGGLAWWQPAAQGEASFTLDFVGRGIPGPWEVQWDADYDGRFQVDARKTQQPPANPSSAVKSNTRLVPPSDEATLVAVRVLDANGIPSRTLQLPTSFRPSHPAPVELLTDVVVPQVRHPVTFDVAFLAPVTSAPWVVQWDLEHDGESFRTTVEDAIPTSVSYDSLRLLGRTRRVHTFTNMGTHRVAMRVRDSAGNVSAVKTWGAEVVCGTPIVPGVEVESPGEAEPVTASLHVRVEPGCEPILRYHWDFDGDGQFDEVTSEPSARHVYADNPTGKSRQKGLVRVESATRYSDRTFEVPIENMPPRVEPIPRLEVTSWLAMTYAVQASDPAGEGDALTYFVAGAPEWVRVSEAGVLSWEAPRQWALGSQRVTFDLLVRDDEGAQTRVAVELVPAARTEPLPVAPDPEGSGGCSTTGGALPGAVVLLGFLLRARRRKAGGVA